MMRKTLVVTPNWIGDALMAQPLFVQFKARHLRAQIHVVAPKWVMPVFVCMPEIAHAPSTDLAHSKLQLGSHAMFAQWFKGGIFDAVYVLPDSFKGVPIPWLAGIPLYIGYKDESRLGVLNVHYSGPPKSVRPPMVQHYTTSAFKPHTKLPDTLPDPKLGVDVQRVAATSIKSNIPGNARPIAFCLGTRYGPAKRWPAGHLAELAQMLCRSFPYIQIVALGSGRDRGVADVIVERAPFVRNLCGGTLPDEAAELPARAEAAICNDSGLMHVATVLGYPQMAALGSNGFRHTPPLSPVTSITWLHLEHSPYFVREYPLGRLCCLRDIDPEMVFYELRRLLQPQ